MKIIKKNLKLITILILVIILAGVIIIKYSLSKNKTEEITLNELDLEIKTDTIVEKENITSEENVQIQNVFVDIKGAVNNPGVYEVSSDKKVIDVVNLANGFTENADTSMINLAKKVYNEMVIVVYTREEVENATETKTVVKVIEKECVCPEIKNDACIKQEETESSYNEDTTPEKININKATLDELITLTGIGESKAKAIISYREENGDFQKVEDIMQVSGIGESAYEKIKDNITV